MLAFALALIATPLGLDATPAPTEPTFIVQPEWEARPGGPDIMRLYPADAVKTGASGQAVVQCAVLADGRLDACQVVAEQPRGLGFGEASVRMAGLFRMKTTTPDGASVDGAQVLIPLNWSLGKQ
jgi:protein TonB